MLGKGLSDRSSALERCDAGRLGGDRVLADVGLEILELELHLLEQATAALGAWAILLPPELGDLQLQVRGDRLDAASRAIALAARASASSARARAVVSSALSAPTGLCGARWTLAMLRVATIDVLEQTGQLQGGERHHTFLRRRPDETALLKPFA